MSDSDLERQRSALVVKDGGCEASSTERRTVAESGVVFSYEERIRKTSAKLREHLVFLEPVRRTKNLVTPDRLPVESQNANLRVSL